MKNIVTKVMIIFSIIGFLYSGITIYGNINKKILISSLNKNVSSLTREKVEKEIKLKEITEKERQSKKELNKLRAEKGIKVIYLTFDDGPTHNTTEILKILKKNNIKATFFVVGKNMEMYKQIVDEGHVIAIHSYTHNYKEIYSSVNAFFYDLYRLQKAIKEKTGIEAKVTRFPGGSSTTIASKALKKEIINRLTKEGFVYQDWNCDSTDASGNGVPVETLVRKSTCDIREVNLLMHDSATKGTTVQALQRIIDNYKSKGYLFEVLTLDSPKFQHVKQPEKVD